MSSDIPKLDAAAGISFTDTRLNELRGNNFTSGIKKKYSDEEKKKLAETTRGFESLFINMIFKGMKEAMVESFKD